MMFLGLFVISNQARLGGVRQAGCTVLPGGGQQTRQIRDSPGEPARSSSHGVRYFVSMGLFVVGGAAAAGENTRVAHAFQPFGRSNESNSS